VTMELRFLDGGASVEAHMREDSGHFTYLEAFSAT
jgi:hypothetical protein